MRVHTAAAVVAALFLASCVFGNTVALRLLLLGFGMVLTSIVLTRKDHGLKPLPPIWLPFLLWAGWAALSVTWSIEPERTLKEWRNEVFYAGAALWICYVSGQVNGASRVFGPVLGTAGVLASAISLWNFSARPEHYAEGWHGGPGDHSSALLVLVPCALVSAWFLHYTRRHFAWLVLLVYVVALFVASAYATLNRTVWLGFAAQLAVIGALLLRRESIQRSARVSARVKGIAIGIMVGIFAIAGAVMAYVDAKRESAASADAVTRDSRLEIWSEIAQRILHRPAFGHGFGRGIDRDSLRRELGGGRNLWHAHNLFLDTALQTGVIGLALFLLVIGSALRAGWRQAFDARDLTAAFGIAFIGVLVGMLVRNTTDTLLVRQNALLFWGVAGFLLGAGTNSWRRT
jgi:O-antigen ligase